MLARLRQTLHRQPAWIALAIVVSLILWVGSGVYADQQAQGQNSEPAPPQRVAKVRVTHMIAQPVSREINLYGRSEPDRIATLRAEIKGRVTHLWVREGQRVTQGQKLLSIDSNDLEQRLISAKALLKQRQLEVEGAKSLGQKGYQSQTNLAAAQAQLEAAVAQVESLQLSLQKTQILAPFDGVMNEQFVEIGDLLKDGDRIATVVDLDPLILKADVTENHIHQLQTGQIAYGRMVSGQRLEGTVRYIASVSNPGTNTFKMEVAVANPQMNLMAGMSTQLSVPLQQTDAIKITPAVLALDESGNLGVKVVEANQVRFVPIDIVKSDRDGVWLAGLGQEADVITLGHGYVRDGDPVEVVFTDTQLQVAK